MVLRDAIAWWPHFKGVANGSGLALVDHVQPVDPSGANEPRRQIRVLFPRRHGQRRRNSLRATRYMHTVCSFLRRYLANDLYPSSRNHATRQNCF